MFVAADAGGGAVAAAVDGAVVMGELDADADENAPVAAIDQESRKDCKATISRPCSGASRSSEPMKEEVRRRENEGTCIFVDASDVFERALSLTGGA